MNDLIAWASGEVPGIRVLIRHRGEQQPSVVIEAAGRQFTLSPSWAAQAASGIDAALARIDRNGRVRGGETR
jgi:hypothetical protein